MEEKRTSVFENGLIWFGAAVSIAEILTGTYFAPLGFGKGLLPFSWAMSSAASCCIWRGSSAARSAEAPWTPPK